MLICWALSEEYEKREKKENNAWNTLKSIYNNVIDYLGGSKGVAKMTYLPTKEEMKIIDKVTPWVCFDFDLNEVFLMENAPDDVKKLYPKWQAIKLPQMN